MSAGDQAKESDRWILKGDDLSQFNQLIAEYKTLPDPPRNPKADDLAKMVVQKADEAKEPLTLYDRDRLEYALLVLTPIERLRREAWNIRERYGRVLSNPRTFDLYQQSKPPDAATAAEAELRADLEQVVGEIHRLRNVGPLREKIRSKLSHRVAQWTLYIASAAIVIFVLALFAPRAWLPGIYNPGLVGLLAIAAFSGAVGGYVSMLRRLDMASSQTSASPTVNASTIMESGQFSALMSPVFGAVFAILLCVLFMAGLVQGTLFPSFVKYVQDWHVLTLFSIHPDTISDMFKLAVWSFIAGFSESLVPDIIDRFTRQAKSAGEAAAIPSSAVNPEPKEDGVSIRVDTESANLAAGESKAFTATVVGDPNTAITWSVQEGDAGGTVTSEGAYTAPGDAGTYHVVATSQADATKKAVITVVVGDGGSDSEKPAGEEGEPPAEPPGGAAQPDFALSADPDAVTATVGEAKSSVLKVAPSGGFTAEVALKAETDPAGPTATLDKASLVPAEDGTYPTCTLSISTAGAAAGAYTVTVTGTAGDKTQSAKVALTLTGAGGNG